MLSYEQLAHQDLALVPLAELVVQLLANCSLVLTQGASASVIDETTVKNSNVKITPEKCNLRAFDNSVVESPGFVQMNIEVGSKLINHKCKVIEAKHGKEVIVSGREFQ